MTHRQIQQIQQKTRVLSDAVVIEHIIATQSKLFVVYKVDGSRNVAVFDNIEHFCKELKEFGGDLESVLETYKKFDYVWHKEALELLRELEQQSIEQSFDDLVIVRVNISEYRNEDFLVSEKLLFDKLRERIYEKLKKKVGELVNDIKDIVESKLEKNLKVERASMSEVFLANVEIWTVRDVLDFIKEKIKCR